MGNKKQLIAVALLAVLLGAGGITYSWRQERAHANTFAGGGYVHIADPETEEKKVAFQSGTAWRKGLNDTVSFEDVQGNQTAVSAESFAHYDDQSLSALTTGVVVDLNDVQTAQVTNHYAVSPQVSFQKSGDGYTLANTATELDFTDYIWKLGEDKYMLVSPQMSVHFSEGDVREAQDYVEVTYVEEGVVQLQTADNVWQTISGDCYADLDNGERVNFSLRNVQDSSGEVLMDFSKIILDSENNIEITPLTEDLENVKESVIPHFDITAEPGKNGESGAEGVSGEQGTQGEKGTKGDEGADGAQGDAGAAGTNGAAGASGSNGSAGSPGAPGAEGAPGSSAEIDGTVLNFPTFTLQDWTVSATTCSATIMVSDPGQMLEPNTTALAAQVYLVDVETNSVFKVEPNEGAFDFSTLNGDGYPMHFEGLLPDHSYRLVVDAPINTRADGAQTYLRNFISKTFYTDSVGVYLEAGSSTEHSVSLTVNKQPYSTAAMAVVKLYDSRSAAQSGTGWIATETVNLTDSSVSVTFSGYNATDNSALASNTTYFARVEVTQPQALNVTQLLPLTTLKQRAAIGAPSMTPNRENWGFSVTPGAVSDPDGGITGYTYEFYNANDVLADGTIRSGAQPVRTVTTTSADGLVVPMDGTYLKAGQDYRVRTVAAFFDNEKESQIVSGFSNAAQVTGNKLPIVYFVNESQSSGTPSDTPTDLSTWYDQICGTLVVAPGTDTAKVLVDDTHHPMVTIRAEGYYYVQYPVYLEGSNNLPTDGSGYLTARQEGGYLYIALPNKALTAATVDHTGAVNGLKPNLQYRVLLTGDLSNDGQNAFESGVAIGSCVVETPDTVLVGADWLNRNENNPDAASAVNVQLHFTPASVEDTASGTSPRFSRQMSTLSSLKLTLTAGSANVVNPTVLGELTLTQDDLKADRNAASATKLEGLGLDPDNLDDTTIGQIMTSGSNANGGLQITEKTFGLSLSQVTRYTVVTLTVSEVYDYTVAAENRVNQQEYDGSYTNEFKVKNARFEVSLGDHPGALEEASITVTAYDDNGDREKDDHYDLSAVYDNGSKLARYITYYVFDQADLVDQYSSANNSWSYDANSREVSVPGIPDGSSTQQLMTPFTTVDASGKGLWLARTTIPVPANAENMPSVRFYPTKAGDYYANDKAKLAAYQAACANESNPTGYYDEDEQSYVFFYDAGLSDEDAAKRGHQFVFAWTMVYEMQMTGSNQKIPRVYPFSIINEDAGSADLTYMGVGQLSQLEDRPRRLPTVTALPWDTSEAGADAQTVTWSVYISDPDGAVVRQEGDYAALYKKQTKFTGILLNDGDTSGGEPAGAKVAVHDAQPADGVTWSVMADAVNQVTIGVSDAGSTPAALRVQRYTNKYTVGGKGIFVDDETKTYTKETVSAYTGSGAAAGADGTAQIPVYCDAFTFYRDKDAFQVPDASRMTLKLDEWTDNATLRGYYVTVTDTGLAELKKAAGIRMTFTANDGTAVTVDKAISGVDQINYGTDHNSVTFRINLANELYLLAEKSGVQVTAALLYESGREGFGAVKDQTASLRTYQPVSDPQSMRLEPLGWYSFNNKGVLQNVNEDEEGAGGSALPRLGSFFKLTMADANAAGKFAVNSTRNGTVVRYTQTLTTTPTGAAGASLGTETLVPRLLAATGSLSGGTLNIPEIIPTIQYTSPSSGANTISVNFALSDASKLGSVYFRLEQVTRDSSGTITSEKLWYCDSKTGICSTDPDEGSEYWQLGGTKIVLSDLEPDQEYRLVGYFKNAKGEYVAMNFSNVELASETNYQFFKTQLEPSVTMRNTQYVASHYYTKYFRSELRISGAENYYYVVELQDESGKLLTYVTAGTDGSRVDLIYLLGRNREVSNFDGKPLNIYDKVTRRDDGSYVCENSGDTAEPLYLQHGRTYTLVTRVYTRGEGPAHGGDRTADMIRTAENDALRRTTFTVSNAEDQFTLEGVYQMTSDGSEIKPTVTFLPTFVKRGAMLRNLVGSVVIIRERKVDGEIVKTDVTSQFVRDGGGTNPLTAGISLNTTQRFLLRQSGDGTAEQVLQPDDVYTCYVYAVQDLNDATTEGYATLDRNGVLAGRLVKDENDVLTEDAKLDLESVDVENGRSILLGTKSVTVTKTATHAGEVSITRDQELGRFLVNLKNPFDQNQIKYIGWSIAATYSYTEGETTTTEVVTDARYASIPMAIGSMMQTSTNTYQIALEPEFDQLPDGATVSSYLITVEFYRADSNGDPLTDAPISASGVTDVSASNGSRVTQTIVVMDSPQETAMMTAMGLLPEEPQAKPEEPGTQVEQPEQQPEGGQPDGQEPGEQPDGETPEEQTPEEQTPDETEPGQSGGQTPDAAQPEPQEPAASEDGSPEEPDSSGGAAPAGDSEDTEEPQDTLEQSEA